MDKVKVQLNVSTKWIVLFFVLTTFSACSNKKKVEVKNNAGIVVESYFVDKHNPDIKIGTYSKFYDDGKIAEVITYSKDGKQNGTHTLYYPSGKLMRQESIVNNVNEGKFVSYYEDGYVEQEGNYKDNKMEGVWKTYADGQKGILKYEATFKDGQFNGPYKEYYPNGKLYAEGNKIQISEDLEVYDGKVQVYDSLGNPEKVLTYDKGRQISKEEIKK